MVKITARGIRETPYGWGQVAVDAYLEASLYVGGNYTGGLIATCGTQDVKGAFYLPKPQVAAARWAAVYTKMAKQVEDWIQANGPRIPDLKAGRMTLPSPTPTPTPRRKLITAWSAARYPDPRGDRLFVRLERLSESRFDHGGIDGHRPRLVIDCRDKAVSIDFAPMVVGDTLKVGFDDGEPQEYPTHSQGSARFFGTPTLVDLFLARQTLVVEFVRDGKTPEAAVFVLKGLDDALAGCTDGTARRR
jgi:hypothetical protein